MFKRSRWLSRRGHNRRRIPRGQGARVRFDLERTAYPHSHSGRHLRRLGRTRRRDTGHAGGGILPGGTHFAKSGSRAANNTSPKFSSNWAASFGEDGVVLAGLFLAIQHPAQVLVALVLVPGAGGVAAAKADLRSRLRRAATDRPRAPRAAQCTIVTVDIESGRGPGRILWSARKTQPTGIGTRAREEEPATRGICRRACCSDAGTAWRCRHGSGMHRGSWRFTCRKNRAAPSQRRRSACSWGVIALRFVAK